MSIKISVEKNLILYIVVVGYNMGETLIIGESPVTRIRRIRHVNTVFENRTAIWQGGNG